MAKDIYYFQPNGNKVDKLGPNEIIRETGLIEKLCEHGVGHPIGYLHKWESWMGTHGCDGCCSKANFWIDEVKGG